MSTTPIDAAALAQARERLERNYQDSRMLRTQSVACMTPDLRLVLDALREARRQAFGEAALGCHLRAGALSRQGKKSAAREAEACGNCIEALGKEQS